MQRAEQRVWQVLPLVPTSAGNSPYTSYSAFAGNPLLISFDALIDQGLLRARDVAPLAELPRSRVDFGAFRTASDRLLRSAFEEFLSTAAPSDWVELDEFIARHQFWLEDYALFMALVGRYGHAEWNRWDSKLARREPAALSTAQHQLSREIRREQFVQWQFFQQWDRLKHYAHRRGVQIFGDAPIFVAYESADVWQQQRLFHLDDQGARTVVAGVPPDYFAATGQLWGNPLYRWDVMEKDGFKFWIDRLGFNATLTIPISSVIASSVVLSSAIKTDTPEMGVFVSFKIVNIFCALNVEEIINSKNTYFGFIKLKSSLLF